MSASEIERFAREWPAQQERWARFAAWQRERLAASPPSAEALAWMDQAWQLARRHDPEWGSTTRVIEGCRHHAEIQRRLGRAGVSA